MVGRKRNPDSLLQGIEMNKNNNKKKKIQSYLHEDIVAEILVRIPAEALYKKFRYVCKSWFNIITNPTPAFVQRNQLLCYSEPGLIYQGMVHTCFRINGNNKQSDQHTYFIKLKEENNQEHDLSTWFKEFTIDACCNGLLLLTSKKNVKHRYVANYVTKQLVMLPPCSSSTRKPEFAFVPSTGEYKVMIPKVDDMWTCQFLGYEILTLGGGFDQEDLRWRRIEAPEIQLHYHLHQQKTVNGVSHVFEFPHAHRIASFDVCTEVFHLNPLPSFGWPTSRARFVEMGSFLAFVNLSTSKNQLEIWILKDFRTGEWIKQHSINMCMENKHIKYNEGIVPVMGFGNSSDATIIFGSRGGPARLWAYNVKLQRWWKMGGMKITMGTGIMSFFGSHTNSLVSLNTLIRKKQTMKSQDSLLDIIDINDNKQKKKHKKMKEEEEEEEKIMVETKAAALPFLSKAVLAEILSRIPAGTLYKKFRYICKPWHNIITNPIHAFIQQNLLCADDPAGLFITDLFQDSVIIDGEPRFSYRTFFIKVTEGSYEESDLTKWFEEYIIQAYCNGLLLLTDRRCHNRHYYVANPLTKKMVMLPPCASFCVKPEFVFNPSTGEYKVMVPMTTTVEMAYIEFNGYEILTLGGCFEKDLRWRQVQGPTIIYFTCRPPITANGVLHVFDLPYKIFSFDVATEEFHEMPLSDFHTTSGFRFLDIGSFLTLMEPAGSSSRNQFDVWILKDFRTGEWVKQQSINMWIEGTKSFYKKNERVVPVMSLGNNGDIIIFGKQQGYGAGRLRAYNVKLRKWWKVGSKRFSTVTASFGRHENKIVSVKDLIRRN